MIAGCQLTENNKTSDKLFDNSETAIDENADVETEYEETNIKETDTIELNFFPIALDGAGIELPKVDLVQFGVKNEIDQNEIYEDINYRVNYIFYGIGLFSGWFNPAEYLISASEAMVGEYVETPVADSAYKIVKIPINYELTSAESDVPDWFLEIDLILQDKESPYILDSWYEIEILVSTIYDIGGKYSTSSCPFEIFVESEIFGNDCYDASLKCWRGDDNNYYGEDFNDNSNISDNMDVMNDETLQYNALIYLNQIANELEDKKHKEGDKSFRASAYAITTIKNRTDDTITIQGDINYWRSGGDPDGTIVVKILMDRYTGNVIMDNFTE